MENSRWAFDEIEQPLGHRWVIELGFSYNTIHYSGREFFDREVIDLSKALFVEFDGIYGVVGMGSDDPEADYAYMEFVRLMKERELKSVLIVPERDKPSWSPIWFYLLNKERYEASKPYLASLPIERVEELPNGGALLLVNYPEFEEECE